MKLCGPTETLDDLQKIAEEKFTDIKNIGREAPHFPGQPCLDEHLQVHISHFLVISMTNVLWQEVYVYYVPFLSV